MVPEIQGATDKIFCHFGPFFALPAPWQHRKSKFKIEKNIWRYYHFTHLHHTWQSFDVWFLRLLFFLRFCNCYFSFWAIFCLFSLVSRKSQNLKKKKKKPGDIIILQMCTKILWWDIQFLRYGVRRMDGWTDGRTDGWTDRRTDGRKKWYIEVGVPPKIHWLN